MLRDVTVMVRTDDPTLNLFDGTMNVLIDGTVRDPINVQVSNTDNIEQIAIPVS